MYNNINKLLVYISQLLYMQLDFLCKLFNNLTKIFNHNKKILIKIESY